MEVTKKSKLFGNAETTIDYKKKTISFTHNVPRTDIKWVNLCYFGNNLYVLTAAIIWLIIYMAVNIKYRNPIVLIITILSIIPLIIILGYISIIVHTLSKIARKNYAKTNAILRVFYYKKKIEIEKGQDFYKYGIIKNKNELILTKYSIVSFEYQYIGENKITKIKTKSIEPKKHKGEHYNYIAIVTFEKPLTEGIFIYR